MVRAYWGLPQPKIPFQPRLHRFLGQVTRLARTTDTDRDPGDFSESTATDELNRLAERAKHIRSLLTPRLHDPLMFSGRFDAELSFTNGEGQGLFAIDVFTCLAGGDDR